MVVEGLQRYPREIKRPRERHGRVQQFTPDSEAFGRLRRRVARKKIHLQFLSVDGHVGRADDFPEAVGNEGKLAAVRIVVGQQLRPSDAAPQPTAGLKDGRRVRLVGPTNPYNTIVQSQPLEVSARTAKYAP